MTAAAAPATAAPATTRAPTRAGCTHSAAHVMAMLAGDAGAELGPSGAGSRWWALDNASEPASALGNCRADVYLGVCSGCGASVVSVRTWAAEHWASEHGPAWSSPWVALVPDADRKPVERRQPCGGRAGQHPGCPFTPLARACSAIDPPAGTGAAGHYHH